MNMARPIRDDDEEKPLDPAVENVRRKMIRFMLINLGLLGFALIAVVGALVYKLGTAKPETPAVAQPGMTVPNDSGAVEAGIALPAGSRVVSQSLSGDRISLYVEGQAGERSLLIYDVAAGRLIARVAITQSN